MFGSQNYYFYKSKTELMQKRKDVETFLLIHNYSTDQLEIYLKAFDFFVQNPDKFDGATIVKDLHHIPDLDLCAMLHDYLYIVFKPASSLKYKLKCDWLYAKEMERTGKGFASWFRFAGLTLTTLLFTPYAIWKNGTATDMQKASFLGHYYTLLNINH